ncbi:hypothetical protein GCM10023168_35220 [Fodinibacter luteus]|uniref:Uncharacterized protein n=1 Tax=Fodinibacter luteus TaxID=552064 RepID=A0ABP8KQZ7_9MICO
MAVAEREGWRALVLPRGGFDVIELWIDNTVMLERSPREWSPTTSPWPLDRGAPADLIAADAPAHARPPVVTVEW